MFDTFIRGILFGAAGEGGNGGGTGNTGAGGAEGAGGDDDSSDDESGEEGDGEGDDSDEDANADELDENEAKEAAQLYKLLKDPKTSKDTLRIMVDRAGINLEKPAPKTEEGKKKEARKVADILQTHLGDEFKFLSAKLTTALEEILGQEREQHAEILGRLDESMAEQEIDSAFRSLSSETKGESKKHEAAMVQMANKVHQAPGTSIKEYVSLLYKLVAPNATSGKSAKDLARQINKNRTDAGERARSSGTGGQRADSGTNGKGGGDGKAAPKGLRAIIEQQFDQLVSGKKK